MVGCRVGAESLLNGAKDGQGFHMVEDKEMDEKIIERAEGKGYEKALDEVLSGKSPYELRARLALGGKDNHLEKPKFDWERFLPIFTSFFLISSAVVFGLFQWWQKNDELEITKVKTLNEIVGRLSSNVPLERKYAVFAATSLKMKDFDEYVLDSLNSLEYIETLEIVIKKGDLSNEIKQKGLMTISRLYATKAEELKESDPDKSKEYLKLATEKYPVNAQARYRLGRFVDKVNLDGAIEFYKKALSDESDPLNAYRKEADLRISIYERLGAVFYRKKLPDEAVNQFKLAKDILESLPDKHPDDIKRLRDVTTCIATETGCVYMNQ